ncbi:hypothetical protein BCV69DRAFT_153111 [Microstroma glucosiphilum]|uniref:Uncharacterized protein n=1 Tax=Pseudomicrostroma glucosiphilum TaxID=1684307 RepID=A0A316UF18_9BASI|nr:hypothetical protein BCV69DRAFT_153111 [Pseudomicrostroma glucosiphilum]PWN21725.1 hypothetical protein BCV69DRAFT_153111 [Pseudomicrostroma glucosiphilum]
MPGQLALTKSSHPSNDYIGSAKVSYKYSNNEQRTTNIPLCNRRMQIIYLSLCFALVVFVVPLCDQCLTCSAVCAYRERGAELCRLVPCACACCSLVGVRREA